MVLTIVLLPSLSFASFTVRLENNFEGRVLEAISKKGFFEITSVNCGIYVRVDP